MQVTENQPKITASPVPWYVHAELLEQINQEK